jgi:hypothetical protein
MKLQGKRNHSVNLEADGRMDWILKEQDMKV